MKQPLRIALLTLLLAVGLLLGPGCSRVINTPAGCRNRIANPAKRAACNACTSRGPRFDYLPDRAPGRRCVRR